jgi:RNA polymerase sigma-70 factor, ECF subfamily
MKARTNEEWLRELSAAGEAQADAIADLRTYLLQAALYSLTRAQSALAHLSPAEIGQMAEDCAQDALLAILQHLHEFRGDSKFTTWTYRFAVNMALVSARRESRKSASLDELLEDSEWPALPIQSDLIAINPDRAALQAEVWRVVHEVIDRDLTGRQRQVLKALVFDEIPIDEIARHFGSNRNAIYKLLHDARRSLKARLKARGFTLREILDVFGAKT